MATLFYATPSAVANFTDGSPITTNIQTGESVAYNATAGPGSTGAIVITTVNTVSSGSQEVGVRSSNTTGGGRSVKWAFMVPSSGTLRAPSVTNFFWSNTGSGNYGATIAQVGIAQARTQSGTTGTSGAYRLFLQTPQDGYATLYYGGTQLLRDTWYTVELRLSNDQIVLYVTDPTSGLQDAQCYIRGANGAAFNGFQFGTVTYGKIVNSALTSYGYIGALNYSQVGMYSLPVPAQSVGSSNVFADLWAGKKARDLRHDGAIVRHMGYSVGSTGDGGYGYSSTGGSDIVSEGQSYGAFSAVQANDQTSFNLIVNFAYTTLCRRNTAVATAQNNGTIGGLTTTFAPNLMGYKYQDDLNTFWDGNCATDSENDMMKAYFLAHGRWGSSSNTVGTSPELIAPNYLQRGINIAHDLKQYTFTASTDSGGNVIQLQSADAINALTEVNPSYSDPWALRLAAQYDTTNATFWTQALAGAFNMLYQNRGQDSYTGPTEWTAYTGTAVRADTNRTSQNGLGYGYNSFRTLHRLYWDYSFYNDIKDITYLGGPIRPFSTTEYTNLGMFAMEKANDGTPFTTANGGSATSAYEKTANTYAQYITQKITTSPTSIASTIKTNKLNWSTLYQAGENGSFVQDAPGGVDSYFMDYWGMFAYAMDNLVMTNYSATGAVTRSKVVTIDAQINTGTLATRSQTVSIDAILKKTLSLVVGMDSIIVNTISPTRQKTVGIDAIILKTVSAVVSMDAMIMVTAVGVQAPVAVQPSNGMNRASLIAFCQKITSNLDSDTSTLFGIYLNLAQRDVESEFPDHPGLHASAQLALVPGFDYSYAFATDFRKELNLRIVSPLNLSHQVKFVEYLDFRAAVTDLATSVVGIPYWWYWAPEAPNQIHFYRVADQPYLVQYDYVKYAADMISDTDLPFFDRMYHQILAYRVLFYYYNSDGVARPAKGAQWDSMYQVGLSTLKQDYQRRQIPMAPIQYGTGVNEGYTSGYRR